VVARARAVPVVLVVAPRQVRLAQRVRRAQPVPAARRVQLVLQAQRVLQAQPVRRALQALQAQPVPAQTLATDRPRPARSQCVGSTVDRAFRSAGHNRSSIGRRSLY
jgi:hypothetical protein